MWDIYLWSISSWRPGVSKDSGRPTHQGRQGRAGRSEGQQGVKKGPSVPVLVAGFRGWGLGVWEKQGRGRMG